MIISDYYRSEPDYTWDIGRQLGVKYGVIRLPEDPDFDPSVRKHWLPVYNRFTDFGIKPIIIEPMPNCLHDHIKAGDEKRDESIEKVIKMFPIMEELDIRTICFNWMAHVGWTRTTDQFPERGGAKVTAFCLDEYEPNDKMITEEALWENYQYFIKAVIPEAEKYGIRLALHPDDPPLDRLGRVSRIMTSYEAFRHAVFDFIESESLGVTFCQATFYMMGEKLERIIPLLKDKIFFIHFRNASGTKMNFHETFHDNGDLNMSQLMQIYRDCGVNVPIRVDHVPTLVGEQSRQAGYDALGRLYAIGYLRGILESLQM